MTQTEPQEGSEADSVLSRGVLMRIPKEVDKNLILLKQNYIPLVMAGSSVDLSQFIWQPTFQAFSWGYNTVING